MPDWEDIISTAEAAEMLETTSDHVARLCREKRVEGRRLLLRKTGTSIWIVSRKSVWAYKTEGRYGYSYWRPQNQPEPPPPWTAE